jgi:hypothetical protein
MRHVVSRRLFAPDRDGQAFWKARVDGARRRGPVNAFTGVREKKSAAAANVKAPGVSRLHARQGCTDRRQR